MKRIVVLKLFPQGTALRLIHNHFDHGLIHFELSVRFLDLRGLLFKLGCERLYLLLLPRDGCLQALDCALQSRKGNAAVTSDASQRHAQPSGSAATPHICAGTVSLAVASSSHGEQEFCPRGRRWYSLRGESCESAEVHRVFS